MCAKKVGSPSLNTIKLLFAEQGHRCAFPNCTEIKEVGADPDTVLVEIAHIRGRNERSARYDPNQLETVNDLENLILLCPTHHTLIDKEPQNYSVEQIQGWKQEKSNYIPNAILSQQLISALAEYSQPAKTKLKNATKVNGFQPWTLDTINTARNRICADFPGTIGLSLRRLFARPEPPPENPDFELVQNSYFTALHTLEVICYGLITQYWNSHESIKDFPSLDNLFSTEHTRLVDLEIMVVGILKFYETHSEMRLPWPELHNEVTTTIREGNNAVSLKKKRIDLIIEPEQGFHYVIQQLQQAYNRVSDIGSFSISDAEKIQLERNLASILSPLAFLANYEMVSLKRVDYRQVMKSQEIYFLHHVGLINGKFVEDSKAYQMLRADKGTIQSLVLRSKNNDESSAPILLFPFLIDTNTLELHHDLKKKTSLARFDRIDEENPTMLYYSHLEGGKEEPFAKEPINPETKILDEKTWKVCEINIICDKINELRRLSGA